MDNNVLAKVGNTEITRTDLLNIMRTLPQNQVAQFSTEEGRKTLLNEMITRELYYLDAIDKKMDEEEDFKKWLEETKHNLLQQYAIQKLLSGIKVDEDNMKEYYEKNKASFMAEEQVKARHILVKDEDQAKKIAEEIKAGKSFEDAAKEYSTCPSKANGGDLGFFGRGKMVPEFEQVAFSLNIGEMSHVVKTQFGYHLILVDEKKEAQSKTFDEVKDQIRQYLIRQQQTIEYTTYADKLKSKYEVKINEQE